MNGAPFMEVTMATTAASMEGKERKELRQAALFFFFSSLHHSVNLIQTYYRREEEKWKKGSLSLSLCTTLMATVPPLVCGAKGSGHCWEEP